MSISSIMKNGKISSTFLPSEIDPNGTTIPEHYFSPALTVLQNNAEQSNAYAAPANSSQQFTNPIDAAAVSSLSFPSNNPLSKNQVLGIKNSSTMNIHFSGAMHVSGCNLGVSQFPPSGNPAAGSQHDISFAPMLLFEFTPLDGSAVLHKSFYIEKPMINAAVYLANNVDQYLHFSCKQSINIGSAVGDYNLDPNLFDGSIYDANNIKVEVKVFTAGYSVNNTGPITLNLPGSTTGLSSTGTVNLVIPCSISQNVCFADFQLS